MNSASESMEALGSLETNVKCKQTTGRCNFEKLKETLVRDSSLWFSQTLHLFKTQEKHFFIIVQGFFFFYLGLE